MNYSWKSLVQRCRESLVHIYEPHEAQAIARRLGEAHSNLSFLQIITDSGLNASVEKAIAFLADLARLEAGEPLQYVLAKTEFMDMELELSPSVLIPRPETEQLVGLIIAQTDFRPACVADFCTGSGCIALALKKNYGTMTKVFGLDICTNALKIAAQNGHKHQLEIEWKVINLLDQKSKYELPNNLDLIVSNPPYIPTLEKSSMAKNVLEHEPALALFVEDHQPIIFYQTIGRAALNLLVSGGQLWFEVHEQYGHQVGLFLEQVGFEQIQIITDFNDKIRFVKATKP